MNVIRLTLRFLHDAAAPLFFFERGFEEIIGRLTFSIINISLSLNVVPVNFKHANMQPLIKKHDLKLMSKTKNRAPLQAATSLKDI